MLFYLLPIMLAQRPSAFGIAFHNIAGLLFSDGFGTVFNKRARFLHPLAGGVAKRDM